MEENSIDIEEEYFRRRLERHQRMRIAMAVVPAIIGLSVLILNSSFSDAREFPFFFPFSRSIMNMIAPIMFFLSGMSILMIYLQTGFKREKNSNVDYLKYENELESLRNKIEHGATISSSDVESIYNEISSLKERVKQNNSINDVIKTEHREELVSILKNELVKESKDLASKEILSRIEEKLKGVSQLKEIEGVFLRTFERLNSEINALSRRGNLNLSLGILTTIVGLSILGYFVLEIDSIPEDKMAFIAHFIPKLSLVVLIEVFAYFFLKLYKSSLSEIKYYQNEMTNSESKLTAIKCAIMNSDEETISFVIKNLSGTERNSVLEKGQTTADIEKSKIEHQNISTISERVSKLLGENKDT